MKEEIDDSFCITLRSPYDKVVSNYIVTKTEMQKIARILFKLYVPGEEDNIFINAKHDVISQVGYSQKTTKKIPCCDGYGCCECA